MQVLAHGDDRIAGQVYITGRGAELIGRTPDDPDEVMGVAGLRAAGEQQHVNATQDYGYRFHFFSNFILFLYRLLRFLLEFELGEFPV